MYSYKMQRISDLLTGSIQRSTNINTGTKSQGSCADHGSFDGEDEGGELGKKEKCTKRKLKQEFKDAQVDYSTPQNPIQLVSATRIEQTVPDRMIRKFPKVHDAELFECLDGEEFMNSEYCKQEYIPSSTQFTYYNFKKRCHQMQRFGLFECLHHHSYLDG
jgi:hypothetical protein